MIYSYILKDNCYEILKNGKCYIRQIGLPISGSSMDSIAVEQLSKLLIEKLNRRLMPIVTQDEENELSTNQVTDERIKELVDIFQNNIV